MSPRVFDREEKRQLLIQAAARVFAEQGFSSTRVSDIAERAGVAKGTVYEYFTSKEELFFAVFERTNQQIRDRVDGVMIAHPSARDRLQWLFRLGAEIVAEQRELYPMMNLDFWVTARGSALEEAFTRSLADLYREYRELAADIIRQGQETGEFRSDAEPGRLATVLVSTFDGLGMQYWLDEAIEPKRCNEDFILALCHGLCQEEA